MKTSRQRIVEYLEKKVVTTPSEIAGAMNMSAANVRHHLRILVEQGVIVHAGYENANKQGRPESLYRLLRTAAAHNLNRLASALIKSMSIGYEKPFDNNLFSKLADYLVDDFAIPQQKHLGSKLQMIIKKLNEMNYKARWEASPRGPRIIFEHCPYYAIIDQHPQLCLMDEALLSNLVGSQVELAIKLRSVSPGLRQCVLEIKAN